MNGIVCVCVVSLKQRRKVHNHVVINAKQSLVVIKSLHNKRVFLYVCLDATLLTSRV